MFIQKKNGEHTIEIIFSFAHFLKFMKKKNSPNGKHKFLFEIMLYSKIIYY